MDENTVADPGERKAIRLSHPAPHGTWMAVELTRERLKIREVGKKVFDVARHICTVALLG